MLSSSYWIRNFYNKLQMYSSSTTPNEENCKNGYKNGISSFEKYFQNDYDTQNIFFLTTKV